MPPQADLILRNGTIWCGYDDGTVPALAVAGGKVLAAGTDADIMALGGADTQIIDLDGQFAMPGLNDAHLHLIATGLMMGWVDASPEAAPTLESLLEALRARAAVTPKGEWVLARGYDQTKLDTGAHPHLRDLDTVLPDHPVMVTRACGHVSVFNSRAFELAGVTVDTPDPDGGLIGREGGALTGMVAENAQGLLRAALPSPDEDMLIDAIERAGRHLLSMGITSCMDAAVGQIAGFAEMPAYQRALAEGRLPVRVWLTLLGDPGVSVVPEARAAGMTSGWGCDMLRLGAVKIFLDGSAGGRTAWMSQPYQGEPQNYGVQILPDAQLNALVRDYHDMGYQLACHAIGDAAIGQLIAAYEGALAASPDPDRRHRIEHCGFSTPEQHARMQAAGIYPCPQQAFIHDFGDAYLEVLGEARARACYPLATWDRLGFRPATGSDSPVCRPVPFPDIHAMITRQTWKGTVMDADEAVSIEKALQCYTEHGAFSQKAEGVKGRLVPGQLADIAVFSRNLLTAAPAEILHDTHCTMTLLEGRIVHRRD